VCVSTVILPVSTTDASAVISALFKQALLIRVGVFLAAFPEPLVEKESVLPPSDGRI
jgi:hypothetical protein